MINLSRYDRRYAALWLPMASVLLAGFSLLAVLVIGVLLTAGLGLAGSALKAWAEFGPRPASILHLLIGVVFAPLLALVAALLVVGGVMMVVIRIVAFENKRRPGAARRRGPYPTAAAPPYGERGLWPYPAEPGSAEEAGSEPADPTRAQDDDKLTDHPGCAQP